MVHPHLGMGMEVSAKERNNDGSKAEPCPGGLGRGVVQRGGCDHGSHRGKESEED